MGNHNVIPGSADRFDWYVVARAGMYLSTCVLVLEIYWTSSTPEGTWSGERRTMWGTGYT